MAQFSSYEVYFSHIMEEYEFYVQHSTDLQKEVFVCSAFQSMTSLSLSLSFFGRC